MDERSVPNHVLQALVPGALAHPDAFTSAQLGEAPPRLIEARAENDVWVITSWRLGYTVCVDVVI